MLSDGLSCRFEGDMPLYVYALNLIRRWSQTFSGGSEKTQTNNEGSGKERSNEVARCRGDLPHFR